MITNEDDAIGKFIQGALSPFGIEVDVQVIRDHDKKMQKPSIWCYKASQGTFSWAGEKALDVGKITRENFYFLVESMKESLPDGITLLEGAFSHLVPKHDCGLLSSGMFIIMGKTIPHVVIKNCHGISGIFPAIVKYIATGKRDSSVEDIALEDIPDPCTREQLKQVCG